MSVHGQPGSAPGVPQAGVPQQPAAYPGAAYPGAMPAQPVAMAQPAPTSIGVWIGIGFALLALFSCLATGAAAALLSERDSVMVSYLTVPLIFAGFVAPIVGGIARKQSAPVAIGSPIGCGCATMMFALVCTIVFYEAIWPSL
jgi:hypothetical protein